MTVAKESFVYLMTKTSYFDILYHKYLTMSYIVGKREKLCTKLAQKQKICYFLIFLFIFLKIFFEDASFPFAQ